MQIKGRRPRGDGRDAGKEINQRRDKKHRIPDAGQIRPERGGVHQRLWQRELKTAAAEDIVVKENIQRTRGIFEALDDPGEHILRREHF